MLSYEDYRDNVSLFFENAISYMPKEIVNKLEIKGYPVIVITDNDNNILYQQVGTISKTELTKILLQ